MRNQLVMNQLIEQKWKLSENILRALLYSMMPRSTFDNLVWLFFFKQLLLCLSIIASQFCFGQWRLFDIRSSTVIIISEISSPKFCQNG